MRTRINWGALLTALTLSAIVPGFIIALTAQAVIEEGWRPVLLHFLSFLWGMLVLCLLVGTVAWLCFLFQSAIDNKAVPVNGRLAVLIYVAFMGGIIMLFLSVLWGDLFDWLRTCFGLLPVPVPDPAFETP
jgi:hypothetical protein